MIDKSFGVWVMIFLGALEGGHPRKGLRTTALREDKNVSLCVAPLYYHIQKPQPTPEKTQSTLRDNNSPSLHLLMGKKMFQTSNIAPGYTPQTGFI